MPEKTKREKVNLKEQKEKTEKSSVEEYENDKQGKWSADQRKKSYYYDDAYGYEVYNPDEEDDGDEEDEDK